jgi:hypothetical protein
VLQYSGPRSVWSRDVIAKGRVKGRNRLTHNPAACASRRTYVATDINTTGKRMPVGGGAELTTHTETCVPHCFTEMMRNELRPGPLGLNVVVLSARKMKLSPFTVASPRLCACAWFT